MAAVAEETGGPQELVVCRLAQNFIFQIWILVFRNLISRYGELEGQSGKFVLHGRYLCLATLMSSVYFLLNLWRIILG